MEIIKCCRCGVDKAVDLFSFRDKLKGIRNAACKECTRKQNKAAYFKYRDNHLRRVGIRRERITKENSRKLFEFMKAHPCIDCGEADILKLEFDHIQPKSGHPTCMISGSWEKIEIELLKCQVRCSSCHNKITHQRANTLRYQYTQGVWQ